MIVIIIIIWLVIEYFINRNNRILYNNRPRSMGYDSFTGQSTYHSGKIDRRGFTPASVIKNLFRLLVILCIIYLLCIKS